MKFKYDIKGNYFKMYGEANYLVDNKKKYLNGKRKSIGNYFTGIILRPVITFILMFLCILFGLELLIIPLFMMSFFYLFLLTLTFNSYKVYKNDNHKGEIIIDDNGITDKSDIVVTFPWDKVELIGITENMMAVVLDSPFVIILEPNDKIIKEIQKYKDVKVIK